MVISQDPEVAIALTMFADKLRTKNKNELADKIENIIDLVREEIEMELKTKPRK
jgi:hypothetical protein